MCYVSEPKICLQLGKKAKVAQSCSKIKVVLPELGAPSFAANLRWFFEITFSGSLDTNHDSLL